MDPATGEPWRVVELDLGIAAREVAIHVALVEGRVKGEDRVDVLLRHRLLPQPSGFEGVVLVLIEAYAHDHAVADRPDPGASSL
jgi:hypothetical protein